uniref:Envelope glycoprotein D n=1 Tax=Parascaris univalens TaxID=6257 RepID=A0A915AZT1_PARUN
VVTMVGCVVLSYILAATIVRGRKQPYFNRDDLYYAECVPSDEIKTYKYYGNQSSYITSISNPQQCSLWSDASNYIRTKRAYTLVWFYPEESLAHNQCRSLDFTLVDKYGRQHAIAYFKLHHGAYPGPWCYAKIVNEFIPMPCFTDCPKEIQTKPMLKKQEPHEERTRNYNARIFDDTSNSIFSSYDWGSPSYYSSKPSDLEHSQQFAQNRETIFFMMVIVVILIVVLIIGFHIMKKFFAPHKKLNTETNANEAPVKVLKKTESTNQPTQTASTTSTGEKRFTTANVEPSDSDAGSVAPSNKKQIRQERETAV